MATVELKHVRKRFGQQEVVHGVDLAIADREFVAFVGPSGSGKSTLLRMIAGLEEVSEGEVLIDGQPVQNVPPAKRGLAMVFQSYALYPHMTVAENMGFSLRLAGVPRRERDEKVLAVARILDMEPLLRPQAAGALRRPVAARGHRPRHGAPAQGVPARRAALQPGCGAAGPDAPGTGAAAPRVEDHHDLRHPRPGGSHDHGRPHRGAERGPRGAGGVAAGAVSEPRQPVCGRLHRRAEDELPRGSRERGRRRTNAR